MCSGRSNTPLRVLGFPIRTSTDRSLIGSSPWLIAAIHVLHRLQAPRHPPLALCSLENLKKMLVLAMEFSRGTTAFRPPSLPGNEEGTTRAYTIREAGGSRLDRSEELTIRVDTYDHQRTMQERIISDQLGVLSCRPKQKRFISQQLTVTP